MIGVYKKIIVIIAFGFNLIGCASPAIDVANRPLAWATPIYANANLYQVDKQLYRSEQLIADDIPIIRKQGINTIINLRFFDRDDNHRQFTDKNLTLINYPLLTWAIKPEQLAKILYEIEQQKKLGKKVLVHCYHGADRTGIVIAMYRIIQQGWTIQEAKQEMMQGGYGYHSIWKNIEKLLTEEKVSEVKKHLQQFPKS